MRRASASGALVALGCVALGACSSLIELDELTKVECVDDCGAAAGATSAGGSGSGGSAAGSSNGKTGGTSSGVAGSSPGAGGSVLGTGGSGGVSSGLAGSSSSAGEANAAGAGGEGHLGPCPGGPEPPPTWKEHWFEHDQDLTLDQYDDCIAVYVDPDMTHADASWLSAFVSQAWLYSLQNYGTLGPDRLFVVLHQGRLAGGHASAFFDPSHDSRNVIDGGAASWVPGGYDLPAHLLSFVVETTAAHSKHGSPGSAQWHDDGFAQIFKYDLYRGLGMTAEAEAAYDEFLPTHFTYPVPNSYWFADWYYPIWRDHGGTQTLVEFFGLLEQYFPATSQVMGDMNWGEYVHFMSGAAGVDLQEQANYAFGWNAQWEQELEQARLDFPSLSYPK